MLKYCLQDARVVIRLLLPAYFAGEANVRMTELKIAAFKLLVVIFAVPLCAAGAAPVEIPVDSDTTAVLPAFLTEVATGAPADSLVLRVSCYSWPGDGRFDPWAYIVVEELPWPPPPLEVRIDLDEQAPTDEPETSCRQVVLAVSRIEGRFLNQARRNAVPPTPVPGMRIGEIGGHWVRPFEFVEWINPLRFVVTDGRGNFEIIWTGRGQFELVTVEGVRP